MLRKVNIRTIEVFKCNVTDKSVILNSFYLILRFEIHIVVF